MEAPPAVNRTSELVNSKNLLKVETLVKSFLINFICDILSILLSNYPPLTELLPQTSETLTNYPLHGNPTAT